MRITNIPNKIAVVLGVTLLLVIGAGSTTISHAQYRNDGQGRRGRNWDGYPNLGGSAQLRQTALNAGYNEGTKEGRNDRARGRQARFGDFSAYQKATKDYSTRLGNREIYRRYYRAAFESGYNTEMGVQNRYNNDRDWNNARDRNNDRDQSRRGRNWDRYGNYGGSFELRQTALNAGYNEGIKEGRNARRRGRNSDFRNLNAYQSAAEDYSSGLGDRETYRRYYREGFENGYGDGYNGS